MAKGIAMSSLDRVSHFATLVLGNKLEKQRQQHTQELQQRHAGEQQKLQESQQRHAAPKDKSKQNSKENSGEIRNPPRP
jgi:hypothetical protein